MRSIFKMFVFAPLLCTTAAFAVENATVKIPFSFESQGKPFPAGTYNVRIDSNLGVLTMSNKDLPGKSQTLSVGPADFVAGTPALDMKFDQIGNLHELHTIQLGPHVTPVLDAHRKNHDKTEEQALGN
jgi:hypothetical protein